MPRPRPQHLEAARRLRAPGQPAPRPDPVAVRARVLGPLWLATAAASAVLAALALGAPDWTGGDPRAALLPGVPAAALAVLALLGRGPARRRPALAAATAVTGMLAVATVSALGALGDPTPAVVFQLACLITAALHLAVAAPCWRRVEAAGGAADELARMYEEL